MPFDHGIVPYEGESFSHYWGRYSNDDIIAVTSSIGFGYGTRTGAIANRWERFFFNPRPTAEEIKVVSKAMVISEEMLRSTLPDSNEKIISKAYRFCAACYAERPWHLMRWQYESCRGCEIHGKKLLSRCPACSQKLPLPSNWCLKSECLRCHFRFARMKKKQQPMRQ